MFRRNFEMFCELFGSCQKCHLLICLQHGFKLKWFSTNAENDFVLLVYILISYLSVMRGRFCSSETLFRACTLACKALKQLNNEIVTYILISIALMLFLNADAKFQVG